MLSPIKKATTAAALLATAFGWAVPAQAYTFSFSDEYFVDTNKFSTFQNLFGTLTGFTGAGIYQLTKTSPPIVVTQISTATTPVVRREFEQDVIPNASSRLDLRGWSATLTNGQPIAEVFNSASPLQGIDALGFGWGSAGVPFRFTFNSFDLRAAREDTPLSIKLVGLNNLNQVVDTAEVTVSSTDYQTFTFDWENLFGVRIEPGAGGPREWTNGLLFMDNVVLNEPVPPPPPSDVPEPASLALLAVGALGLGIARRRKF